MKWIMACTLLVLTASIPSLEAVEAKTVSGAIRPRMSVRTDPLDLAQGDLISVRAKGPEELALDVSVYLQSTGGLVAKSDDDAVEPFKWSVAQNGRYYVALRNSSDVAGEYEIQFTTPQSKGLPSNLPDTAIVKLFYATDRGVTQRQTNKGTIYGGEPSADLQFGVCKVSIPRDHRMGELESVSILRLELHEDPSKHIVLLNTQPEDASTFFHQVSERVNQSAGKEALVFVHGFNTDFEAAARRAAQITYDLAFDGASLLFSWPSQGKAGLIEYNKDGRNAEGSVPHFTEFISQLASQTGVRRIHVIAHSMGNRVVVRALAAADKPDKPRIRQLALLAPDIDAQEFRRLAVGMKSAADHVTLYASSRDEALKMSEYLAGYPRAGEGEPNLLLVPGIDTVDASAVDTSLVGLWHSYFADNQSILSDLFYLIRDNLPGQRVRLRQHVIRGGNYWAFVPAIR